MKLKRLSFKNDFEVIPGNSRSQAAEMTLQPGKSEGGLKNKHRGADQWLFVISGRGTAIVNGKSHKLSKWTLLLIERGNTHEIRNNGTTPLRTLNIYLPPAYNQAGDELPAAKP